jgi:hypothetical protein
MTRSLSTMILGVALFGGACGSVQSLDATGGTSGQAGALGTGGVAGASGGTGGGSAGAPGTGGKAAGGHAGGGHGGAGGHVGAGGHGGAAGGTGGLGGQGGQTCDEIKAAYEQAQVAAMSCTLGAANQCQAMALIGPLDMCPGCAQYVNDATALNALRAQWEAQSCSQPVLCPAIACVVPRAATCVAGDGSSGATCQPGALTTSN